MIRIIGAISLYARIFPMSIAASPIHMIDVATHHMSWLFHKLLETFFTQSLTDLVFGYSQVADVEIPSYYRCFIFLDHAQKLSNELIWVSSIWSIDIDDIKICWVKFRYLHFWCNVVWIRFEDLRLEKGCYSFPFSHRSVVNTVGRQCQWTLFIFM